MKCPKCGSDDLFNPGALYNVKQCRSCGYMWTKWQQSEIDALRSELEDWKIGYAHIQAKLKEKQETLEIAERMGKYWEQKAELIGKPIFPDLNDDRIGPGIPEPRERMERENKEGK